MVRYLAQKRQLFSVCFFLAALGLVFFSAAHPAPAFALSSGVVISQVYGGGSNNTNSTFLYDYIELFNRGSAPVNLAGWSVQYASSTGSTWLVTPLGGTLQPGQAYLIQEDGNIFYGQPLPTPDKIGTIAMSASLGKVALVNSTAVLSGVCPSSASIIDFVGYGNVGCAEGAPVSTLSNNTAALRQANGCTETDNNAADFAVATPRPRNTASPLTPCTTPTNPTGAGAANPNQVFIGEATLLTVNVTPGEFPPSTGITVTANLTSIGGAAAQTLFDDATNGDVIANDNIFSLRFTMPAGASLGSKNLPVTIRDAQDRAGATSITLIVAPPKIAIHAIQGAGHLSPQNQQAVSTQGIVTALRATGNRPGLFVQDPQPDDDPATSEAIFVFTGAGSNPGTLANIGDLILVQGTVNEFRANANDLSVTEIISPTLTRLASNNALPAPTVMGVGGQIPPASVIEDDAAGDVETSGVFDPANDGIDFYEALEGMRVQINDARVVGARVDWGDQREMVVVGDAGNYAGVFDARGSLLVRPSDFNPERIFLSDATGAVTLPAVNVGDRFPGALVGVMDYRASKFQLQVVTLPGMLAGGLQPTSTAPATVNQLALAVLDAGHLAPSDPASKYDALANQIVKQLQSPDILVVAPIQEDGIAAGDGVIDASTAFTNLIAAIQAAGGATYQYRQIEPANQQDGTANPRQGFLFRVDRGLAFIDRPGATATTANAIVGAGANAQLQYSPGRIDPANAAFANQRKPLAAEFVFNSHRLFVIAVDFISKDSDPPLFGRYQPPAFSSDAQRLQQAQIVNAFVAALVAANPDADVIVLGDVNDVDFSPAVAALKGTVLNNLIDAVPPDERYTFIAEGNAAAVDHLLLSQHLFTARPFALDIAHRNAEFAGAPSQHDAPVARITLNDPPTVDAGGAYQVDEGSAVMLNATGVDPENGALTFAWDLRNTGVFDTLGQSVLFTGVDGTITQTVRVRVTDNGGLTATAPATITVRNLAPTAAFTTTTAPRVEGANITLALSDQFDPSAIDVSAGFKYSFDCANDGVFEANNAPANTFGCVYPDNGTYTARGRIQDKDGGYTDYAMPVNVQNAPPIIDAITIKPEPSLKGGVVNLSATFSDAGQNDAPFACAINFGDGTAIVNGNLAGNICTAAHTYANSGTFSVSVSITDKDNATGTKSTTHNVNAPPTVDAGGPYAVDEGNSVTVSATGNDPENGGLTFAWDLDNNGTFEVPGQTALYTGVDGTSVKTIRVQATDNVGLTAIATTTVNIQNVAPTAKFSATTSPLTEGTPITFAFTNQFDPSPLDVSAGFKYSYDCTNDGAFEAIDVLAATFACTYGDNGTFTARGRIKDKDAGFTDYTATIVVVNVPPAISALKVTPEPSAMGGAVNASATFSEAGQNDAPFTCMFDFGDGTAIASGAVSGNVCNAPVHVYAKGGSFTLSVTIADKDGGTGTKSATHIVNRPPSVTIGNTYTVNEGASMPVSAAGSDPDGGALTYAWDLDNNGTFETPGQSVTFSAGTRDGPGSYKITVRVTDNGGLTATASTNVTVVNVAPTAKFSATPSPVSKGAPATLAFSSQTDPSTADVSAGFKYSYDCTNDGAFEAIDIASGTFNCTYANGGNYTARGRIKDKDGGYTDYTNALTVQNTPPTVNAIVIRSGPAKEGSPVIVGATYSHPSQKDVAIACTVNFGDGSPTANAQVAGNNCSFPPHVYRDNGTYAITVTVSDKNLGSSSKSMPLVVENVAPKLDDLTLSKNPATLQTMVNASVKFSDPGVLDTHTATWDWGDGTTSPGIVSEKNGAGSATSAHTYKTPGIYTVKVSVKDKDGGIGQASTKIIVYKTDDHFEAGCGKIDLGDRDKDGHPKGQLDFDLPEKSIHFQSTLYHWLVVTGAKATWQGAGKINGKGDYRFQASILRDAKECKFRIKIWNGADGKVIYDSQPGEDDDADPRDAPHGNLRLH